MNKEMEKVQKIGNTLVDAFHYLPCLILVAQWSGPPSTNIWG